LKDYLLEGVEDKQPQVVFGQETLAHDDAVRIVPDSPAVGDK
jgi:hypothetical protein